MGKAKNASGASKGDTITIRVSSELKRQITKLWKMSEAQDSPFQSFVLILVRKGIAAAIVQNARQTDDLVTSLKIPMSLGAGPFGETDESAGRAGSAT